MRGNIPDSLRHDLRFWLTQCGLLRTQLAVDIAAGGGILIQQKNMSYPGAAESLGTPGANATQSYHSHAAMAEFLHGLCSQKGLCPAKSFVHFHTILWKKRGG
jgi:hypothetical protein